MDNYKYIDLTTYEVLDDCPAYIHCDKEIVDIIAILNKKGYKTKASCAGHNKLLYNVDEYSDDISNLKKIKQSSTNRITRISGDRVYYKSEIIGSSTYISFVKEYEFPYLPIGFEYDNRYNLNLLSKELYYYFDDGCTNRKSDDVLEKELRNNWEVLKVWALSLPSVKENRV